MNTVMVKVYPGTGRPNQFEVADTKVEVERLSGFGYSIVDTDKPDEYTISDAWDEYTKIDADGFTQWK